MIEAKVLFDREAARMLSRIGLRTNRRSRVSRYVLGACGGLLLLCGLGLFFLGIADGTSLFSGLLYTLLGGFLLYYAVWGIFRLSWKRTVQKNAQVKQLHYVFTEHNIHSDTPLSSSDMDWAMVKRVEREDGWLFLEMGNGFILLEEQDLVQGTMEELLAMARRHGLKAGSRR